MKTLLLRQESHQLPHRCMGRHQCEVAGVVVSYQCGCLRNVLPTHYSYTFPGLTEADCKKKAYQLLASISLHEYRVEATMPGDTVTFPWTPLQVTGTGTPFDTTYQIARITRTFDTRGYLQTVDARTVPPGTTIELT